MPHIETETLARLVDEAPNAEQAEHLQRCTACREVLDGLHAGKRALGMLPTPEPPAGAWAALEARLREEGLVRELPRTRYAAPARRTLLRIAAAVLLFVAGAAVGAAWQANPGGEPVAVEDSPRPGPASVEQAARGLAEAEATYLGAAAHFAELAGPSDTGDPAARLAVLEGILLTTGAALHEAPADPIINSYHLTARGQRDDLLRRIAADVNDPWY